MITKKLNFTNVTGKITVKNDSPGRLPFDPDYNVESFIFTVPRKISYDAAVRECKKRYTMVVKDSIFVDYETHEYSITEKDFIDAAHLIK